MKHIGIIFLSICILGMQSCYNYQNLEKRTVMAGHTGSSSLNNSGNDIFLKAHMRNGSMYVFKTWRPDTSAKSITGSGKLYDFNRTLLDTGKFTIHIDSIAIAETNTLKESNVGAGLMIMTVASASLTAFCVINPKACFGSCPTFYAQSGDSLMLVAEGFSSSVAPSLEAADVDALVPVLPKSRDFMLTMKNEALETHVVRHADIMSVPKKGSARVFKSTQGEFWRCSNPESPILAQDKTGNCVDLLKAMDGKERFSATDSTDLAAREEIDIEFLKAPGKSAGIVIGARQTLLSTFLFYQTLAYLGTGAGEWFARLENDESGFLKTQIRRAELHLGGIEMLAQNSEGKWESVGEIYEHGPLAADQHIIPLPEWAEHSTKFRIKMSKGSWRIDYAGLAAIEGKTEAVRIHPQLVFKNNAPAPEALSALLDPLQTLVTMPGEAYDIHYRLPEDFADSEIFLESKGYYLEWMRQEWLAEENPALAVEIFVSPVSALRRLAPKFKSVEHTMEESFWRSRYAGQ
ncbi:MAG: hypothetical protein V4642_03275 [Bacteroidota bacterium]